MRKKIIFILIALVNMFFIEKTLCYPGSGDSVKSSSEGLNSNGSYYTGVYHNLFTSLLGYSESLVKIKVDNAFKQLFYGDNNTQRVNYPIDSDMAYIEDILHHDVRTEGMSYGMMISVQLDKKTEFDRLWKWAKTYLQHQKGSCKNYFAWHAETNGKILDSNSASDGEEWFVMALFFACARWGNGEGIYNYNKEAQTILDAMLNKESDPENDGKIKNMFNRKEKQVVFVPDIAGSAFTDPSYHLPHYYELWGRWANNNNQFWCNAASISRKFLMKTTHPLTGLAPDYANFDGSPIDPWGGGNNDFRFDAWRVAMNISLDYSWFAKDSTAVTWSNRLLNFFYSQGIENYGNLYKLEGKCFSFDHSAGLVAMNAVASLISTNLNKEDFVKELWNTPIPVGPARYYDGLLYMMAILQLSGNFKIYDPTGIPVPDCPILIK